MAGDIKKLIKEVVSSPLGDMIASVGEGVAEAQQALDDASLEKTLAIYSEGGDAALTMLREIGYRPTFYALPETTGEMTVSLSLGQNPQKNPTRQNTSSATPAVVMTQLSRTGRNIGFKPRLYATPVDGGYSNKYGYQANISAKLTFKIVPVPPPAEIEDLRIIPAFESLSVTDAISLGEDFELELDFVDATGAVIDTPMDIDVITTQKPSTNTIGRRGDVVLLTINS